MEAALFGMFVLAVSCDQISAIFSDETAVEAVQRRSRMDYRRSNVRRRSRMSLLKEVCGRGMKNSTLYACHETYQLMNVGKRLTNHYHYSNPIIIDFQALSCYGSFLAHRTKRKRTSSPLPNRDKRISTSEFSNPSKGILISQRKCA